MFDGKYFPLKKRGTFGWTRLTYVADLSKAAKTGPSFGLWGAGYVLDRRRQYAARRNGRETHR